MKRTERREGGKTYRKRGKEILQKQNEVNKSERVCSNDGMIVCKRTKCEERGVELAKKSNSTSL